MRFLLFLLFFQLSNTLAQAPFDLQGHRGARGLWPENSLPGMLEAVRLGVTTLELDVVITADSQVVLSHEPWMNPSICLAADGAKLSPAEGKQRSIFQMTYAELRRYDCGSQGHPLFPEQQKMQVHKPLLRELFEAVEAYTRAQQLPPVHYNIEIKSLAGEEGFHRPALATYVDLVVQQIQAAGLTERCIIQSFDPAALRYLRAQHPPLRLAYLVESKLNHKAALKALGFVPDVYSPYHKLLRPALLRYAKKHGMLVIPWTINAPADMQRAIALGVDGIITDYPDRLLDVLAADE